MDSSVRTLAGLAAALLVAVACATAWAQKSPSVKTVAVIVDGGTAAQTVKQEIERTVPSTLGLLGDAGAKAALASAGFKGEVGRWLEQPRRQLVAALADAARRAGVSLLVLGSVSAPTKGDSSIMLMVINADAGRAELDQKVSLAAKSSGRKSKKKSNRIDTSRVENLLVPIFRSAALDKPADTALATPSWAQAESGVQTKERPSEESMAASDPVEKGQRPLERAFLVLAPSYALFGRNLSYGGSLGPGVRPYKALGVSLLGVSADIFPTVLMPDANPNLSRLGLRLAYARALGLSSSPEENDAASVDTTWSTLVIELRGRARLGSVLLGAGLGFVNSVLSFAASDGTDISAQVASLSYKLLRLGVDARIPLRKLTLLASATLEKVVGGGALYSDYYPNASGFGFGFEGGVAYPLLPSLEARALLSFAQLSHSLDPDAGTPYQAESASDREYGLTLGAAAHF